MITGRTDPVLLRIDPDPLDAPARWEPGAPGDAGGVWFPHVYDPIPTSAVVSVAPYPPGPDRRFRPPGALTGE